MPQVKPKFNLLLQTNPILIKEMNNDGLVHTPKTKFINN